MINKMHKKHDQIIKQIYRTISYYLAEKLKNTAISPNHITISRVILIILASIFILSYNYTFHIFASLLLILFSIFDALDGSLASKKDKYSVLGTWLDPQIDRLGFLLLFLTISIYLSSIGKVYIFLSMYVLVIYIFRSLIPTDIRLKDKFMSLRENNPKNIKSNSNNNQKKTNKFLYQIKLQTSPHTHNIILYIALGLIFKSLNLIIIFLSIYLSLWYLWENYKVITKAIIIDKK
jgi:phosphatidylglycerophosphate synthase